MRAQDAGGAAALATEGLEGDMLPLGETRMVSMESWRPWSLVLRRGLEVGVGIGLFTEESESELPGLEGASASWSTDTTPSKT